MSQSEELKESMSERRSAISSGPQPSERSFEHKDQNGLDKSETNLKVKASMARELRAMGLEIEAIGRILRTETSRVEEWLAQLNFEEESR